MIITAQPVCMHVFTFTPGSSSPPWLHSAKGIRPSLSLSSGLRDRLPDTPPFPKSPPALRFSERSCPSPLSPCVCVFTRIHIHAHLAGVQHTQQKGGHQCVKSVSYPSPLSSFSLPLSSLSSFLSLLSPLRLHLSPRVFLSRVSLVWPASALL